MGDHVGKGLGARRHRRGGEPRRAVLGSRRRRRPRRGIARGSVVREQEDLWRQEQDGGRGDVRGRGNRQTGRLHGSRERRELCLEKPARTQEQKPYVINIFSLSTPWCVKYDFW